MGCLNIKSGSEDDLKVAVATVGPIAVNIDASQDAFQFYKYRIFNFGLRIASLLPVVRTGKRKLVCHTFTDLLPTV